VTISKFAGFATDDAMLRKLALPLADRLTPTEIGNRWCFIVDQLHGKAVNQLVAQCKFSAMRYSSVHF
jgi:hypothetical protein